MAEVEDLDAAREEREGASEESNGHGDPDQISADLILSGDGQLSLAIGGKSPTHSEVVIRGGAISFDGQLKKGDRVTLQIDVVCAEVHMIDVRDAQTRQVDQVKRKHVLKIEGCEKVD